MIKLIILLAALCTMAYAEGGYGHGGRYMVDYGFTAGGHGGYGGHGHGGHAYVNAHQNPHHYRFGVQEHGHGNRHHYQSADTGYGYGR